MAKKVKDYKRASALRTRKVTANLHEVIMKMALVPVSLDGLNTLHTLSEAMVKVLDLDCQIDSSGERS